LLSFFLPFTWGRHRRARATTALPRATSLELLILFGNSRNRSGGSAPQFRSLGMLVFTDLQEQNTINR
jgi:hypothetical protein